MNHILTKTSFAVLATLCAAAGLASPSSAGTLGPPNPGVVDPDIVVVIEGPKGDVAGVQNIQGFAIAHSGIDEVLWELDGQPMGNLPHGGSRGDVEAAYPQYPAGYANASGFSSTWSMGLLEPGEHEIKVFAYDDFGAMNMATQTFTSYRFGPDDEKFIKQAEMSMQSFLLQDVKLYPDVDPALLYDVEFAWSQAAQSWIISKITEVCGHASKCFTLAVTAPSGLAVSYDAGRDVNELSWTANYPDVVGYEIQRRNVQLLGQILDAGPWVTVGLAPGFDPSWDDEDLPLLQPVGTFQEYRVRAFNATNPSGWTVPASVPGGGPVLVP